MGSRVCAHPSSPSYTRLLEAPPEECPVECQVVCLVECPEECLAVLPPAALAVLDPPSRRSTNFPDQGPVFFECYFSIIFHSRPQNSRGTLFQNRAFTVYPDMSLFTDKTLFVKVNLSFV